MTSDPVYRNALPRFDREGEIEPDYRARLSPPSGHARVVIDTDPYNEIDDQFAIAMALAHPTKLTVEAIYAAPFCGHFAATPADGMNASYAEANRLLDAISPPARPKVLHGSEAYLTTTTTAVASAATDDLIARAFASPETLYVASIAAPTNIANALLLEPKLAERIAVVWLGGNALHYFTPDEFNLKQDRAAVETLLSAGVPLTLVPCGGVASALATSLPELEHYLSGESRTAQYFRSIADRCPWISFGSRKVLWDVAVVAYLLNDDWTLSQLTPTPKLDADLTWRFAAGGPAMNYVYHLQRDQIFADLFRSVAAAA